MRKERHSWNIGDSDLLRCHRGTPTEELAHYTSASLRNYWEWEDTSHCSPGELAAVFLERFPKLAGLGYGQDWAYAGWYQYMLHVTYPDALPIANSPYDNYPIQPGSAAEPEPEGYMTTEGARIIQFALPPVGLAPCKPRNQGSPR